MAREMKDSGIEWIGEIPIEWVVLRNKDIFYEVNERCEDGSKYTLLSVSEYSGITPRSTVIKDGEYETHAETLDGYKICRSGDIVMNIMLAWKRATAASSYDGIVSPAYCVYRGKGVDTKYYHYLFRTDNCADMFKRYSTGIIDSRLRLYPEMFLSLRSIVPPYDEQKRISHYLDTECSRIDTVINQTRASIEEYKKLKQSVITEAVTKGIRKDRPMKDSGIGWLGDIPFEWQVKKTKYFSDGFCKGSGITKEDVIKDGHVPCVRYGEIYTKFNQSFEKCVSYTELERISSPQFFSKGDILFTCTGELIEEIGKCIAYVGDEECLAGGDIIVMKHSQNPSFMSYVLNSDYAQAQKSCGKTKLKVVHVSAAEIKNVVIAVPSLEEQKEIADYLDKICAEISVLIEEKVILISELEKYKKSMIYEYVTGKKEVV